MHSLYPCIHAISEQDHTWRASAQIGSQQELGLELLDYVILRKIINFSKFQLL